MKPDRRRAAPASSATPALTVGCATKRVSRQLVAGPERQSVGVGIALALLRRRTPRCRDTGRRPATTAAGAGAPAARWSRSPAPASADGNAGADCDWRARARRSGRDTPRTRCRTRPPRVSTDCGRERLPIRTACRSAGLPWVAWHAIQVLFQWPVSENGGSDGGCSTAARRGIQLRSAIR